MHFSDILSKKNLPNDFDLLPKRSSIDLSIHKRSVKVAGRQIIIIRKDDGFFLEKCVGSENYPQFHEKKIEYFFSEIGEDKEKYLF